MVFKKTDHDLVHANNTIRSALKFALGYGNSMRTENDPYGDDCDCATCRILRGNENCIKKLIKKVSETI